MPVSDPYLKGAEWGYPPLDTGIFKSFSNDPRFRRRAQIEMREENLRSWCVIWAVLLAVLVILTSVGAALAAPCRQSGAKVEQEPAKTHSTIESVPWST